MGCRRPSTASSTLTASATRGSESSRCSCPPRRRSATACRTATEPGSVLGPVATAPSAASVTRAAMSVALCAGHHGGGETWSSGAAATSVGDEAQVVITSRAATVTLVAAAVTGVVDDDGVPSSRSGRRAGVARRWCGPHMLAPTG
jgi:hypothetical protein